MEMHQVRYFLAMAERLNFTRAAEDCNVTQPSLTRAIQKLEDEFGGPLFRRERSRTHLTDLGRLMLPHLERTFEAAQAAKSLARDVGKAQVTPLALGVASSIESDALDAVIAELGAGLPGFKLSIVSGPSEVLIQSGMAGELDLLIVEAPDDPPERFDAWPLFEHLHHMITRADHAFAVEGSARLEALRTEAWIECDGDGAHALRRAAEGAGFDVSFHHKVDSMAQLRRLILAGLGSGFAPPPRDCAGLAVVRIEDFASSKRVILAAIGGRRRSIAADAFVRSARARAWEMA